MDRVASSGPLLHPASNTSTKIVLLSDKIATVLVVSLHRQFAGKSVVVKLGGAVIDRKSDLALAEDVLLLRRASGCAAFSSMAVRKVTTLRLVGKEPEFKAWPQGHRRRDPRDSSDAGSEDQPRSRSRSIARPRHLAGRGLRRGGGRRAAGSDASGLAFRFVGNARKAAATDPPAAGRRADAGHFDGRRQPRRPALRECLCSAKAVANEGREVRRPHRRPGLLDDVNDETSLVERSRPGCAVPSWSSVGKGMHSKAQGLCRGSRSGRQLHIIDGPVNHSLLIELLTDHGVGTMVRQEKLETSPSDWT